MRPPRLASAGEGYHLYVSKNNPGAEELACELQVAAAAAEASTKKGAVFSFSASSTKDGVDKKEGGLRWTTDESERENASRFLLLLNSATWGQANQRLAQLSA